MSSWATPPCLPRSALIHYPRDATFSPTLMRLFTLATTSWKVTPHAKKRNLKFRENPGKKHDMRWNPEPLAPPPMWGHMFWFSLIYTLGENPPKRSLQPGCGRNGGVRNTTTEHNLFISVTLEHSEFLVLFLRRKRAWEEASWSMPSRMNYLTRDIFSGVHFLCEKCCEAFCWGIKSFCGFRKVKHVITLC